MIGKMLSTLDIVQRDRNKVETGKEYIRLKRESLIQALTEKYSNYDMYWLYLLQV